MATGPTSNADRAEGVIPKAALKLSEASASVEATLLNVSTNRIYRFRVRHPWVYGLIAFIIGGGAIAVFTMTTYKNWAYQSIDLKVALYQIIFGGLGGGIVAVALAFGYTAAVSPTVPALRASGLIGAEEARLVRPPTNNTPHKR